MPKCTQCLSRHSSGDLEKCNCPDCRGSNTRLCEECLEEHRMYKCDGCSREFDYEELTRCKCPDCRGSKTRLCDDCLDEHQMLKCEGCSSEFDYDELTRCKCPACRGSTTRLCEDCLEEHRMLECDGCSREFDFEKLTKCKCPDCRGSKTRLCEDCLEEHQMQTGCQRLGKSAYVMYHGTSSAAARSIRRNGFRPSDDGMLGAGVYVSRDKQKAKLYGPAVLKLLVHVGRVKRIDFQGHPMQKSWHNHGYDSAWVPPDCGMVRSGLEENCIFDPSRIEIMS